MSSPMSGRVGDIQLHPDILMLRADLIQQGDALIEWTVEKLFVDGEVKGLQQRRDSVRREAPAEPAAEIAKGPVVFRCSVHPRWSAGEEDEIARTDGRRLVDEVPGQHAALLLLRVVGGGKGQLAAGKR